MADPIEVVPTIIYYDDKGNEIDSKGNKKSGGGIFAGILEAVPNILKSLFPNGIGGGGNSNYPVMTTLPGGTQSVNLGSNNMLMFLLIGMVGFLIITMTPKKKK
ncbi:MAG TPA: hypothetical protein VGN64_04220 [Dyadobacter sp.]|jgi:hypothetical protein|nr:hypothetical protein [Dyadobacter sp.]